MQARTHYHLLTFYKFVDIEHPLEEIRKHLNFCKDIGIKGRIYIGEEGISATVSCNDGQLLAYQAFLASNPYFNDVQDQIAKKTSRVSGHQFDKLIVRYREEIVALGHKINEASFKASLQRLSAQGLKDIIDNQDKDRVILDMRNSYEYKLGHFKSAIPAGTINFREVEHLLEDYQHQFADKKVLMYCTGGIRCDKLSVLLKSKGINNFYALDGGVVEYVNTHNDGNWLGNLYTFDGVISKKIGDEETHTTIGRCIYSGLATNNAENCRYSPCNARILARKKHYKRHGGFCSQECYDHALHDGLVKNESFDSFDYKGQRQAVKKGLVHQQDFLERVQHHLNNFVVDKQFTHLTSQKEELIDKAYLAQWFADNQRLRRTSS